MPGENNREDGSSGGVEEEEDSDQEDLHNQRRRNREGNTGSKQPTLGLECLVKSIYYIRLSGESPYRPLNAFFI